MYSIVGRPHEVAKVYSRSPDQKKAKKLFAMCEASTPQLLRIAAWPTDVALDAAGQVRGFVMRRVAARRDVHELYSPKSRVDAFRQATFPFVVHVAANIARAFAAVHESGHVVGDVNHGSVLVGQDGTVMMIDCDSFQIRAGAEMFTCDVGVPLFTAPELQGRSFRGLQRTVNHDRFGLAVLIFHLLHMGRHPFAGRFSGHGEMPIERAIHECRFAYGPDRALHQMERPPATVPIEAMGNRVAKYFLQAFGLSGATIGRPEATRWVETLQGLESGLKRCATSPSHHFLATLSSCPWCKIERQTGARLFGQPIARVGPRGAISVGELWHAISLVAGPGDDPPIPPQRPFRLPASLVARRTLKVGRQAVGWAIITFGFVSCYALVDDGGAIWAIAAWIVAYGIWPHPSKLRVAEADRVLAAARSSWESALARWTREASAERFKLCVQELATARSEFEDLANERKRRLSKLHAERQARQRQRYLDRFRIDRASIEAIGPSRTAMLAAYGIETAADVSRAAVSKVPGFGPILTGNLLSWRQAHDQNFRFNPNDRDIEQDIAAMDRDLEARRQALLAKLQDGPTMLRGLSNDIQVARQRLMPALDRAWATYKTAEARRSAM